MVIIEIVMILRMAIRSCSVTRMWIRFIMHHAHFPLLVDKSIMTFDFPFIITLLKPKMTIMPEGKKLEFSFSVRNLNKPFSCIVAKFVGMWTVHSEHLVLHSFAVSETRRRRKRAGRRFVKTCAVVLVAFLF